MADASRSPVVIVLEDEVPMTWQKMYSGVHWSQRKQEADRVHLLVRSQIDPEVAPFDIPVDITVAYYFDDGRTVRDPDNVCAKFYIDGLCPHVIEDDTFRQVRSVTTMIREDRQNPRVEIAITPAP